MKPNLRLARLNEQRRKFVLALPGGLALTSPFALIGCSGDDDAPEQTPATQTPATAPVLPLGEVGVTVAAPAGVSTSGTQARTFFSSRAVGSDGRVTATIVADGPQWATLESAAGRPLLVGWLTPTRTRLSARSTAEAVLFLGLGGFLLPPGLRGRFIDEIAARNDLGALEAAIDASVSARGVLDLSDARIVAAMSVLRPRRASAPPLRSALAALARPQTVRVEPGGQVSGLSVLNEGLNQIRIQNVYRRRAVGVIERIAYKLPGAEEVRIDPPQPFWTGEIAPMTMSTTFTGTVAGALADWSLGTSTLIENYTSAYTDLPLVPATAEYTLYRVSLAGGGFTNGDATGWNGDKEFLRQVTVLKTLAFDIIVPIVVGQILPSISSGFIPTPFPNEAYQETVLALRSLISSLMSVAPEIWRKADEGDLPGALLALAQALILDSSAQTAFLVFTFRFAIGIIGPDGKVQGKLFELLPALSEGEFVAKAGKVFAIIGLVDQVLAAADLVLWAEGLIRSNKVDTSEVRISASNLDISPATALVGVGSTTTLTALLKDKPTNPLALITYKWSLAGDAGGTLRNTTSGATGATLTTSVPIVEYLAVADAVPDKVASVSVEAILTFISEGGTTPVPPPASIAANVARLTIAANPSGATGPFSTLTVVHHEFTANDRGPAGGHLATFVSERFEFPKSGKNVEFRIYYGEKLYYHLVVRPLPLGPAKAFPLGAATPSVPTLFFVKEGKPTGATGFEVSAIVGDYGNRLVTEVHGVSWQIDFGDGVKERALLAEVMATKRVEAREVA